MRSPLPATVIIACPHCGTRYQLPADMLGAGGRQVKCAHCGEAWQAGGAAMAGEAGAPPEDDTLFDEAAERDLDAAFEAAEQALAKESDAAAVPVDSPGTGAERTPVIVSRPAAMPRRTETGQRRKRQQAYARRQRRLRAQSPLARLRLVIRAVALTGLLLLIAVGLVFRVEIVRMVPDLAGAYAAIGLPVNVVGLEFRDVTTLVTLREGRPVLRVDARIYSVAPRRVPIPPVVVTLLDEAGHSIYEWRVTPAAADLEPGEVVDFSAQLNAPPEAAVRARLGFARTAATGAAGSMVQRNGQES